MFIKQKIKPSNDRNNKKKKKDREKLNIIYYIIIKLKGNFKLYKIIKVCKFYR